MVKAVLWQDESSQRVDHGQGEERVAGVDAGRKTIEHQ